MDIEAEFPELSGYRKVCTRLHPRPGVPKPQDSSVGGPLLWPRDEPWPTCQEPHPRDRGRRARNVHEWRRILAEAWRRDPAVGPSTEELDALSVLEQEHHVPELDDTAPVPLLPVVQVFVKDVPGLMEHQYRELLPADVQQRIEAWEAEAEEQAEESYADEADFVTYHHDLSIAPGWKIGDYASWSVTRRT